MSALDLADLAAPLEEVVGHPVHLGELSTASLIYAKEAIATGRWLFCHDILARDLFAASRKPDGRIWCSSSVRSRSRSSREPPGERTQNPALA